MKIFLYGDNATNAGPSNANKALIANADSSLLYFKHTDRVRKAVELFWNVRKADVIVVSGGCNLTRLKQIKRMHQNAKIVYLMHGNLEYENKVNNLNLTEDALQGEIELLRSAERIVCVSERYAHWVSEKYPQYRSKIRFVNNGLKLERRPKIKKESGTIAVSGGNRAIKNNKEVCEAVQKLIDEGLPCKVVVFGRIYPNNDDILKYPFVEYKGHLDKEEYYKQLDSKSLFVLNSELESFGIALGDALNCGCSVLLSDNVGAGSILKLEEEDCIHNPHDVDELAEKIRNALLHPNIDRLWVSVDKEACSAKSSYLKLKKICEEILN